MDIALISKDAIGSDDIIYWRLPDVASYLEKLVRKGTG